uniref:Lysine-specific demethylase phf2 n=1 Tax=Rhizophora mucronata TaxID=61149 RepID=A0A2P2N9B1_RHIMU
MEELELLCLVTWIRLRANMETRYVASQTEEVVC